MSFLFGAILELLWILVSGFFNLGFVMFGELFDWLFELGASYPVVSIPIVILVVWGIINSVKNSIHNRRVERDLKRALEIMRERRERREMM